MGVERSARGRQGRVGTRPVLTDTTPRRHRVNETSVVAVRRNPLITGRLRRQRNIPIGASSEQLAHVTHLEETEDDRTRSMHDESTTQCSDLLTCRKQHVQAARIQIRDFRQVDDEVAVGGRNHLVERRTEMCHVVQIDSPRTAMVVTPWGPTSDVIPNGTSSDTKNPPEVLRPVGCPRC